ncbi:MAG: ribosome silencing factor [Candidatus Margulisiibacteriota bacterium]
MMETIILSLAAFLSERHAEAVVVYDVAEKSSVTDAIVLASAKNTVHLKALAESVSRWLAEHRAEGDAAGLYPSPRVSGMADSGWLVLDCNTIIIHLLTEEMRIRYELDSLFEKRAAQILHV